MFLISKLLLTDLSLSALCTGTQPPAVAPGLRADYRSVDGGLHWSAGTAVANLTDVNCEAAVVAMYDESIDADTADPLRLAGSNSVATATTGSSGVTTTTTTTTTLFFSEPHGPGRRSLRIYCSRDHGKTW